MLQEKFKIRILLYGDDKTGKSYYFDQIAGTLSSDSMEDELTVDSEDNPVRVLDKTLTFERAIVTITLVDINIDKEKVKSPQAEGAIWNKELAKADFILVFYSVVKARSLKILYVKRAADVLAAKNADKQKEAEENREKWALPFALYGSNFDKREKEGIKISSKTAMEVLKEYKGMFAVQTSTLSSKNIVQVLKDICYEYGRIICKIDIDDRKSEDNRSRTKSFFLSVALTRPKRKGKCKEPI